MHLQLIRDKRLGVTLYRGFGFTVLMYGLHRASHFAFKTAIDPFATTKHRKLLLSPLSTLIPALACYPLDTLRRRAMISSANTPDKYHGLYDCVATIIKNEGWLALYAGFSVTVARELLAVILPLVLEWIVAKVKQHYRKPTIRELSGS